jgi:dihydrodipicolinate reductase
MTVEVCLADASGWAGSELARSIAKAPDLDLVAGVARTHAGSQADDPPRCGQQRTLVCGDGALLAIRKVSTLVGVHRGLDAVLDR